jgi:tRNA(fMet)-specific endonuclease VapC
MTIYALDSDTISLFHAGHPAVTMRCLAVPRQSLAVTVISVEEVLSGWYKLLRQAKRRDQVARAYFRLAQSVQFLGGLQILPYSEPAIDRFELLKTLKLGVRAPDLRIAATALEHGAIVVTRNLRDFCVVPGLAVEDWSQP